MPFKTIVIMKLLEVSVNENGQIGIESMNEDYLEKILSKATKEKKEELFRSLLVEMTDKIWKDRKTGISRVIRLLSMAEMCTCAQPYSQAEEFWSTMMFSFIPHYEKFSSSLKQKYGFKPGDVVRPFTVGDTSVFQLNRGAKKNGKWRS